MARSSGGRSAISRAVQVLEAFDPSSNELALTQISARTGLPMATAHGIVTELIGLGLLERRGRDLILGVRLWELAVRAPGVVGLREHALPHLERVRDRLQQHAQLGILQDNEVLYLERLSAPESVVNWTKVGGRIPWYATSSGLVLVAESPTRLQEEVLGQPRPQFSVEPHPSSGDLRPALAKVRREGHAVTRGYIHPDATAVAVPVKGPYGHAVAAFSVVVPTEGFQVGPVLEVLAPAARAVSAELKQTYS